MTDALLVGILPEIQRGNHSRVLGIPRPGDIFSNPLGALAGTRPPDYNLSFPGQMSRPECHILSHRTPWVRPRKRAHFDGVWSQVLNDVQIKQFGECNVDPLLTVHPSPFQISPGNGSGNGGTLLLLGLPQHEQCRVFKVFAAAAAASTFDQKARK